MMSSRLELLVCINQILYCYGLVPQIITNYRLKSGRGLSIIFLFLSFNTAVVALYYLLCLPFPLFYRASVLFQVTCIVILLAQRLYYQPPHMSRRPFMVFILNVGAAFAFLPFALRAPKQFGHAAGWVGVILSIVCRLPQIIKILLERSVYGFNYVSVAVAGLAAMMELIIVLVYRLPIQTLMTTAVSILCFVIFTYQFWLYKWAEG